VTRPTPELRDAHAGTWAITAHALAAALLGCVEATRIGDGVLALACVARFALTGLVLGASVVLLERVAERLADRAPDGSHRRAPWIAAAVLAVPAAIATLAWAPSLLDDPARYVAALVVWLVTAVAIVLGRWLGRGDRTMRAIAILAVAGLIGVVFWAKRQAAAAGDLEAAIGGALAVLVLAGVALRLAVRARLALVGFLVLTVLVLGAGLTAVTAGLADDADRARIARHGELSAALLALWRPR
jgi:hypothetical protein